MQAVAEKTKTKTKKSKVPAVLTVIALLLAATGFAFYWFIMRAPAGRRHPPAFFSSMPVDTAGNNLTGNLPENLQAGGFMAGQNGWLYYANFNDGGSLYMCRDGGESMVKLTDFPVANISVMSDTLVFTGLERCYAMSPEGAYEVTFDSIADMLFKIQGAYKCWYGGPLYAIYGINSPGSELAFALLEPAGENGCLFPSLDKDGLFVSTGTSIKNQLTGSMGNIGDGWIVGQYVHGDVIYAELCSETETRIIRVDKKTLQPLDSLRGDSLYRAGNGFVFRSLDSGFVYHISPDGKEIIPISVMPVSSMTVDQFGEITATLPGGIDILIANELYYPDIVGRAMAKFKRIILQNGWYNYLAPGSGLLSYIPYPGIFCANGEYYQAEQSGVWLKNDVPVNWLFTPALTPVANKDTFKPETAFTPSWQIAAAEGEAAGTENAEDFGNEVAIDDKTQGEPSASAEPRNALDAAVMLLRKDDSIYDKYSVESVDTLKAYYGDRFDKAVDTAAQELSGGIGSQLGAAPNSQTISGIVTNWLKVAKYSVGNAKISTDNALVTLSTSHIADTGLIASVVETEVMSRAAKNPMMLLRSKEQQAAWALDILLEIFEKPEQYHIFSEEAAENNVTMQLDSEVGWVVKDMAELLECFARGA